MAEGHGGTQSSHGGARPGSGRKAKAEKYAPKITAIEDRLADRLPVIIDNLEALADGGYERVKKKFEPAGLIFVTDILRDKAGNAYRDENGEPITGKVRAFPDKEADEMVCVEMTTETADHDRAANIYLADRILGKPTQAVDLTSNGETVTGLVPQMTDDELDARLLDLYERGLNERDQKRKAAAAV